MQSAPFYTSPIWLTAGFPASNRVKWKHNVHHSTSNLSTMTDSITITPPDDWHLHLRDGSMLQTVVGHSANQFTRAMVMPNLVPPATKCQQLLDYRQRILAALPADSQFNPIMALYLTDQLDEAEIREAASNPHIGAVKLYPAGATTNSDSGVSDLQAIYPILELMQKYDLPLLVHGEVTDPEVDIFDREAVFIERHLLPIIETFGNLRVVLEHVTTANGIAFVEQSREGIAGTLTAHHLLLNRNHLLVGGIHPHHYCLPVLKRESHRQALIAAATSGNPRFFAGTDSAPHPKSEKESACGCAGIYTAPIAVELYAEVFDTADALNQLEGFLSHHGADFYRLPRNSGEITLQRTPRPVDVEFGQDDQRVVPLRAGGWCQWQVMNVTN